MVNTCNCGDTEPVYRPDENNWEPGCWECYYKSNNKNHDVLDMHDVMDTVSTDEDLPF